MSDFCCDVRKADHHLFIPVRADWALWHLISNALPFFLFSPLCAATQVDTKLLRRSATTNSLSIRGSGACGCRASRQQDLTEERHYYSLILPSTQHSVGLLLQSCREWECHDSTLGPGHLVSCHDVTDGVVILISHNKGRSLAWIYQSCWDSNFANLCLLDTFGVCCKWNIRFKLCKKKEKCNKQNPTKYFGLVSCENILIQLN